MWKIDVCDYHFFVTLSQLYLQLVLIFGRDLSFFFTEGRGLGVVGWGGFPLRWFY